MKKRILKLTILFISLFFSILQVEAASYTITVGTKNLSKGKTTKLTIKGSDVTGRFNIKSSNESVISISEDRAWIENDSYTITLSALKVGTSTITVTPSGVSDGAGNSANLSSKSIKITVSLPREKSTDDNLKSLSVEGYEITPEFSKDTLEYSVNVPEGTTSVKVLATPNSGYASVIGTGEIDVIEGINNLSVVVKAESGKEKTYKLTVNVIDQNPINVKVDKEDYTVVKLRKNYTCPEFFEDSEQVIENIPVPSCVNKKINYTLVGLKNNEGNIESFIFKDNSYIKYNEIVSTSIKIINKKYDKEINGLKEYTEIINGEEYQVFKYSDNSRFFVVNGINIENGEENLYLYDSKNKTFSVYDEEYINYLSELNQTYLYVIIAFGCGLFLSLICIIMLSRRRKANKQKQVKKKDKSKKNEKDEENIEEEVKEEDANEIVEENKTETYYLFENDKKRKHKKNK